MLDLQIISRDRGKCGWKGHGELAEQPWGRSCVERCVRDARSWREDRVVTTETCNTIADGLATCVPLETNVRAIRELVDDVSLVSEDELLKAIRTLLFDEHLVAEAAGAASAATYLQNPTSYAGRSVVLLITGSNIPNELLARAITK